ncbi:type II secretion system F family protein [Salmonella enterica]
MSNTYNYYVLTPDGKKQRGQVEATTHEQARMILRKDNLLILSLSECHWGGRFFSQRMRLLSSRELMLFFRQLSLLVSSSMSLSDSLLFLARGAKIKNARAIYLSLHQRVCEGNAFSDVLLSQPRIFSPAIGAVIQAGEKSGHMDEALKSLASYLEYRYEMRAAFIQATIYPAVLITVSFLIITVLMAVAVPGITEQLVQSGVALPLSTKILISVSHFLAFNWLQIITGLLFFGQLVRFLLRRPTVRCYRDQLLLRCPVIGQMYRDDQNGMLLLTLTILTQFSIPALDAFSISRTVLSNQWMKDKLSLACESIRQGSEISAALKMVRIFDETTLALLSAGEQSGELHRMVSFASSLLKRESQSRMSTLIKIVEPALIFCIGFIVLFIFMSIMQPMLDLNNTPL